MAETSPTKTDKSPKDKAKAMVASWKTTVLGGIAIVSGIANAVFDFMDNESFIALLSVVLGGGFILTRDADKTSEDSKIK